MCYIVARVSGRDDARGEPDATNGPLHERRTASGPVVWVDTAADQEQRDSCTAARVTASPSTQAEPPEASPIGLYFARLWYHEDLYPEIFAISGLAAA